VKKEQLMVIIVLLIVTSGVLVYFSGLIQGPPIEYGDVTAEEGAMLIEKIPSLVILDVRTDLEYSEEHIEGAVNIPVEELEQRIDELDNSNEFIVYCRTGNRSGTAISIMERYGFDKIFHLSDGINGWKNVGYPTVK
jgi:rhodanese-related sulfurtransferase